MIIYKQPVQNCFKTFKYRAGCFVLQQGSEISQRADSSSVHKRLIKPPSFFENERTLIWCQVCYCPRTEIISLSAHKRWVTRINQTLIHRIGQHGGEEKFTGAKCVICCQSLYAWWQCCAGFWSRTLGLYYYSCLIIMIFWPLLILEDPQSLWSVSCLGLISSQHEEAAVPNINIRFEKYRANMNLTQSK